MVFSLLIACSSTPSDSPYPTNTPKKINISEADLDKICTQSNDLPVGYFLKEVEEDITNTSHEAKFRIGLEKYYKNNWDAANLPSIYCKLFVYRTTENAISVFPTDSSIGSRFELRDYGDQVSGSFIQVGDILSYVYTFRLGRVYVRLDFFSYREVEYEEIDALVKSIFSRLVQYDTD